jgi:hypothetical protein
MKKLNLLVLMLSLLFIFTSCNKQKNNLETTSTDIIERENITTETVTPEVTEAITPEAEEDIQDIQFTYDYSRQDDNFEIIPGKDGQPDEVDIASGHKIKTSKSTSSDGKYYIYDNGEYYYTYERYCAPVEGERKDLNLIMLKEKSELFNPTDLGENEKNVCSPGCEFVAIARSSEPISFNEQTSYWFKVSEDKWIPGSAVYIQVGAFEKLAVEDLEIRMAFEEIKDGEWFVVNTDDGSSLRLRDSSNIKLGKVISNIPQGTWIYADAQTSKTETIDGKEARWYKIIYPETGYVFGGYLEKQDDVCGLKFAQLDITSYPHDNSDNYTFKVYSAPSTKSEYLGEYEIKPDKYGYRAMIETNKYETVDGIQGIWINIEEPVKGFIFGYNFIYK